MNLPLPPIDRATAREAWRDCTDIIAELKERRAAVLADCKPDECPDDAAGEINSQIEDAEQYRDEIAEQWGLGLWECR